MKFFLLLLVAVGFLFPETLNSGIWNSGVVEFELSIVEDPQQYSLTDKDKDLIAKMTGEPRTYYLLSKHGVEMRIPVYVSENDPNRLLVGYRGGRSQWLHAYLGDRTGWCCTTNADVNLITHPSREYVVRVGSMPTKAEDFANPQAKLTIARSDQKAEISFVDYRGENRLSINLDEAVRDSGQEKDAKWEKETADKEVTERFFRTKAVVIEKYPVYVKHDDPKKMFTFTRFGSFRIDLNRKDVVLPMMPPSYKTDKYLVLRWDPSKRLRGVPAAVENFDQGRGLGQFEFGVDRVFWR